MKATKKSCKIIAIAGGSGSGKTTLAREIQKRLGTEKVSILSQDNYYIDQSARFTEDGSVNFDHPSALDFDLMTLHLEQLHRSESICIPVYDFATHTRVKMDLPFEFRPVVLVDGILILSVPHLVERFDLKVFVDTPEQLRFERRLKRDTQERGRHPEGVRVQFFSHVKPMHDQFVDPSKSCADLVIPGDRAWDMEVLELVERIENL